MEELRQEYRLQNIDRLIRDLGRVGDSEAALEAWLGHPIPSMTAEEFGILTKYVGAMEEAVAKKKPKPILPARKRPQR